MHHVEYKYHNVLEVHTASIITLRMEAPKTSETLVNLYQFAWGYNPEDSPLILTAMRTINHTRFYNSFT
jgi:hypothetical protein